MYDALSSDYDRFVNWPNRLDFELPFLEHQLRSIEAKRVLDAACGTGMHAISLAQRGYQVAGADLSARMVEKGVENASARAVSIQLAQAGFGELARTFQGSPVFPFDAVLCLGNSLPHLLSLPELNLALQDFAACLRPGGLVLIQNRNFDLVLAQRARWMEPQTHREPNAEWLFLRFYDFEPNGLIQFNILDLRRQPGEDWQQKVTSTHLYPQRQAELVAALETTGFTSISSYGSMNGEPFDASLSANLILAARRKQEQS